MGPLRPLYQSASTIHLFSHARAAAARPTMTLSATLTTSQGCSWIDPLSNVLRKRSPGARWQPRNSKEKTLAPPERARSVPGLWAVSGSVGVGRFGVPGLFWVPSAGATTLQPARSWPPTVGGVSEGIVHIPSPSVAIFSVVIGCFGSDADRWFAQTSAMQTCMMAQAMFFVRSYGVSRTRCIWNAHSIVASALGHSYMQSGKSNTFSSYWIIP